MITPVFICTHGRPDKQITLDVLRKAGYTGKIYLVVDDEDITVDRLHENYPDVEILMFHKQHYVDTVDKGTNEDQRKCILYAKCFCEDKAIELCLDAFAMADDDMPSFRYRYIEDGTLKSQRIHSTFDGIVKSYVEFMLSGDLTAVGFGFAQFYFTGVEAFSAKNTEKYRIPYTFVFRNPKYRVNWMSWFGEDIVTAVYHNKIGHKMLAVPYVQQDIVSIGQEDGGMKDVYDKNSSIRLAMQNTMYLPVELRPYQYKGRFMASIKREHAFPKLISSSFKKL